MENDFQRKWINANSHNFLFVQPFFGTLHIFCLCVFCVSCVFFFVQAQRVRFASLRERGNIFGEKNVNENKLRKNIKKNKEEKKKVKKISERGDTSEKTHQRRHTKKEKTYQKRDGKREI